MKEDAKSKLITKYIVTDASVRDMFTLHEIFVQNKDKGVKKLEIIFWIVE